jgi:hypothetical protein
MSNLNSHLKDQYIIRCVILNNIIIPPTLQIHYQT